MRIWAREWKSSRMIKDMTIEDYAPDTRTHKVFNALEKICHEFDLPQPIWLDSNLKEFKRHARCRFGQDSFVEEIPFDYLEIQIIEEDI